jgi:hypothetical protein
VGQRIQPGGKIQGQPVVIRDDGLKGELPAQLTRLLQRIGLPARSNHINPKVLQVADLISVTRDHEAGVDLGRSSSRGVRRVREETRSVRTHNADTSKGINLAPPDFVWGVKLVRCLPVGVTQQRVISVGCHNCNVIATVHTARAQSLELSFNGGKVIVAGQIGREQTRNRSTPIREVSLRGGVQNIKNKLYLCLGFRCHQRSTLIVAYEIGLYLHRSYRV